MWEKPACRMCQKQIEHASEAVVYGWNVHARYVHTSCYLTTLKAPRPGIDSMVFALLGMSSASMDKQIEKLRTMDPASPDARRGLAAFQSGAYLMFIIFAIILDASVLILLLHLSALGANPVDWLAFVLLACLALLFSSSVVAYPVNLRQLDRMVAQAQSKA
jgi:hypothetical protein